MRCTIKGQNNKSDDRLVRFIHFKMKCWVRHWLFESFLTAISRDIYHALIMVAVCNRADHYIFILFLSSASFFFFLA